MNDVLQILSYIAIILTFFIYWWMLVKMHKQVTIAHKASHLNNIFTLIDYIQRPEHVKARKTLFSLRGKELNSWTPDELNDAERAASSWDVVGILLQQMDDEDATQIILKAWDQSIRDSYAIASLELLPSLTQARNGGNWDRFRWLANLV